MNKDFDCVEMKGKAQERIHEETRALTREQELAYYHEAGERFWREMERLRNNTSGQETVPQRTA